MKLYHNYLFLFGFFYYLVCPIVVQYFGLLEEFPAMKLFYESTLTGDLLIRYLLMSLCLLITFYAGSYSALFFRRNKLNKLIILEKEKNVKSYPSVKIWFLLPIFLINQYLIISHKSILFTGYTFDYPVDFLGKIATLNSLYLFLFLYTRMIPDKKKGLLTFLLIENSLVLIGMGSRMFVLIPVVAFLVYLVDRGKIKIRKLLFVSIICILFFVVVGVFRVGRSEIVSDVFLYIGLSEPLLTWLTASSFVENNPSIHLIDYPENFIGTFLNFIPSFLFPNKADFIPSIPYEYDSPFGATSILTSLYGNFGILIAPLVMFVGGFLLTVIRYKKNIFFQIYYYCCCGIIPFLLFRDIQSANKLLFTGFLLFPAIAIYCHFLKCKRSEMKHCFK